MFSTWSSYDIKDIHQNGSANQLRLLMVSADLQICFPGLPGFNSSTWHHMSCSLPNSQSACKVCKDSLTALEELPLSYLFAGLLVETCKRLFQVSVLALSLFNLLYISTIYLSQAIRGSSTLMVSFVHYKPKTSDETLTAGHLVEYCHLWHVKTSSSKQVPSA